MDRSGSDRFTGARLGIFGRTGGSWVTEAVLAALGPLELRLAGALEVATARPDVGPRRRNPASRAR